MMTIAARYILLLGLLGSILSEGVAQTNWRDITSVEDLYAAYPERIATIFDHLNLDYPGLEEVKVAYDSGQMVEASQRLLRYYRDNDTAPRFRHEQPARTQRTIAKADTVLTNVFTIQNVRGQVPWRADGHRDWHYQGPNDDQEWAWLSNRHPQLMTVLSAYFERGNPAYATYIDAFLRDFIIASLPYPAEKSSTPVWRGLEVAARAHNWSRVFYGLINSDYLSPAAQLLILSSLPEHAHYNRNFHIGGNWLTMEMAALARGAALFPEFRQADAWLTYAVATMTESMREQVYPDGVQAELTAHYHRVALRSFEVFQEICKDAQRPLPDFYTRTLEAMYDYLAHAVRPSGFRVLNNDGDLGDDRPTILAGAEKFNRPDWAYVATNGAQGTRPPDGPSYVYPWAGQLISRSGFDADAHWSFFDVGPWGTGHQHNDKLHLSVAAYGRDLLVDGGRFAYTGEVARKFRPYALSSAAHNTLLIDGKGQMAGPLRAEESNRDFKITVAFDYASASFDRFKADGAVEHRRSVLYVRGEFWVVVDRVVTAQPRTVEALWHWHPACDVQQAGDTVRSTNPRGNLAIVPVSNHNFAITLTKGQEEPSVQGWYSPEYNVAQPAVASSYRADIDKDATFMWLLLPSAQESPTAEAEIIAESDREVQLRVKWNKRTWRLTVPFVDSERASLVED